MLSNISQIVTESGPYGIIVLPGLPEKLHTPAKILGVLISLGLVPFLVLRFGIRAINWMTADGKLLLLLLRYLIGAVVGSVAVGLLSGGLMMLMLFLSLLIPGHDADPQVVFAMSFLVTLPISEAVITIVMVPGLAVICMYVLVPLELLLAVFRAFCWRVVQYSKGAWAGLILVLTTILGVLDFVSKAHK